MMTIPDELIRQRSYEIWQREGCPHGMAGEHWVQAKTELEVELRAIAARGARFPIVDGDPHQVVVARPPISYPPRKLVASRLKEPDTRAA
jgi:hypothetical protein